MAKFSLPCKFEIYKATLPTEEGPILILSSDEANALSKVVLFCSLVATSKGLSLNAPTNILLPPEESGLAEPMVAYMGNVFTLPKNGLVELLGHIRNKHTRRRIDAGIELLFGLRAWVE